MAFEMSAAFCGFGSVTDSSRIAVFCGVLTPMALASSDAVVFKFNSSMTGFRTSGDFAIWRTRSIWLCVYVDPWLRSMAGAAES